MEGTLTLKGQLEPPLKTLEEIAEPIVNMVEHINSRSRTDNQGHYNLTMLFSSRGSFPFIHALNYITREKITPNTNFHVVPHIFSIENLNEILTDAGKRIYQHIEPILGRFEADIAKGMSHKVKRVSVENTVLSDWDEVVTGSNRVERVKIYNHCHSCADVPFYVISFVGERGIRLSRANNRRFNKFAKRSPTNIQYLEHRAQSSISWSDDEEFFNKAGFRYPEIAVPESHRLYCEFVRGAADSFYGTFLRNHAAQFGQFIGEKTAQYKLIELPPERTYIVDDAEIVMDTSFAAYKATVAHLRRRKGIRADQQKQSYKIDYEKGIVLRSGLGKKEQVVLSRRREAEGLSVEFVNFRNPFILTYTANAPTAAIVSRLMNDYFAQYKANGNK